MSKCYLLLREWKKRIPQRQLSQIRYCHPGLASVSGKETSHCPPGPCPAPSLPERGQGRPCCPGRQQPRGPQGRAGGPAPGDCFAVPRRPWPRPPLPRGTRTARGGSRASPKPPGPVRASRGRTDGTIEPGGLSGSLTRCQGRTPRVRRERRNRGPRAGPRCAKPLVRGGGLLPGPGGHPGGSSTPSRATPPYPGQAAGRHLRLSRAPASRETGAACLWQLPACSVGTRAGLHTGPVTTASVTMAELLV